MSAESSAFPDWVSGADTASGRDWVSDLFVEADASSDGTASRGNAASLPTDEHQKRLPLLERSSVPSLGRSVRLAARILPRDLRDRQLLEWEDHIACEAEQEEGDAAGTVRSILCRSVLPIVLEAWTRRVRRGSWGTR